MQDVGGALQSARVVNRLNGAEVAELDMHM
jgi:hypothetical protein